MRLTDTLQTSNGLYRKFCADLRDTVFSVDESDLQSALEGAQQLYGLSSWRLQKLYDVEYSYFLARCRRTVRPPKDLLQGFDKLCSIYTGQVDAEGNALFSKRTLKEIGRARPHILQGSSTSVVM
jgi:hypothetical protein